MIERGYNNFGRIVTELNGKKMGTGYMARCPAHDDRTPSLSLTEKDGKILFRCHAGCSQMEVLTALCDRGLWASSARFANPILPGRSNRRKKYNPHKRSVTPERKPALGPVIATYEYLDEQSSPLFRVNRYHPKAFRAERLTPSGIWMPGTEGVRRVIYHLPEVISNPIVFIAEGEKDTNTLRSYGFTATTNPFGAGNWRDEFNPFFQGKEVYLIPDNNRAGWTRMKQIAEGIKPYADWIAIVPVKEGKDITEWFELGHSEVELAEMIEACHG